MSSGASSGLHAGLKDVVNSAQHVTRDAAQTLNIMTALSRSECVAVGAKGWPVGSIRRPMSARRSSVRVAI